MKRKLAIYTRIYAKDSNRREKKGQKKDADAISAAKQIVRITKVNRGTAHQFFLFSPLYSQLYGRSSLQCTAFRSVNKVLRNKRIGGQCEQRLPE